MRGGSTRLDTTTNSIDVARMARSFEWPGEAVLAYRLRWKRHRLLWRSLRKRGQLA